MLVGSMLQLVKAAGFLPRFDDIGEDDAKDYINTMMEFLRMVRDNDPNSEDPRAARLWDMVSNRNG